MKFSKVIISACLLFIATIAFGQQEDKIQKSFDVGSSGSLSIYNSFGDVNIEPYSGSKIEVVVTISLETKNSSDYQKYRDQIQIEAKESGNQISLRTINEMKGGNKVKSFDIQYDVKVPSKTNLDIRLTFGNLKIDGTNGVVKANIQHGDCYIGKAPASGHKISLQFGDLRIDEIGNAEVNLQHGDFDADKLNNKSLDLQFGDGRIEILEGSGKIDIQHGDLKIENMGKVMGDIEIEIQFGDLRIEGIDKGNFDLEMYGNFSDFSWDGSYTILERKTGMNSESYKMEPTSANGQKTKIIIEAGHSDVDLR